MRLQRFVATTLFGLVLAAVGCQMSNDPKDPKVPSQPEESGFPSLPSGAGAIDEKASKDFITTASGLKYRILREGAGVKPTARQEVEVHYHGWLDDGSVFDSSYRRRESIAFGLNQVIPGWTEGMQLVGKGGMIELSIPYKLGYGERGSPPVIPPRAQLHFLVELLDVK